MATRSQYVRDIDTNRPGHVVEVRVLYQTGGSNWFHGTEERGGYYATFQVVEVKVGDGYVSRISMLGSGRKVLMSEAGRFGQKAMSRAVDIIRKRIDEQDPETVKHMTEVASADYLTLQLR